MVANPISYSLEELRNLPSRSQITRHDCVEGWSAIAKWTGVQLSALLDEAQPKPNARYVVFHCYDSLEPGEPYYASISKMRCTRRPCSPMNGTINYCPFATVRHCG